MNFGPLRLLAIIALALVLITVRAADPYFQDTTLAPSPGLVVSANSVAVSSDQKIYVGGDMTSESGMYRSIVRLGETGQVDATFRPGHTFAQFGSITLISGGSIAGIALHENSGAAVVKMASDGTLLWTADVKTNGPISWLESSLLALPDGTLLVGGSFTNIAGIPRLSLALLGSDGLPRPAFDLAFNGAVTSLARTADGLVYAGGSFTTVNGVPRKHLVRLKSDGSIDLAFDPGQIASVEVSSLALQQDGKVIVGGVLNTESGGAVKRLFRLLADGSVDSQFQIGLGPDDAPKRIAVDVLDRIILVGSFNRVDGLARPRVARLLSNGAVDASFNLQSGPNRVVRDVAIDNQGRYVIAGAFDKIGTRDQFALARFFPDEVGPTVDFEINHFATAEDNVQISIPLKRFGPAENPIVVEISTEPTTNQTEFTRVTRQVEFAPNELSKSVIIPIPNDGEVEGDEVLELRCRVLSGGPLAERIAEIIIHDDEIPVIFQETVNSPLYRFSPFSFPPITLAESNGLLALGGEISSIHPPYSYFKGLVISRMDGAPKIALEATIAQYSGAPQVLSLAWTPDNKLLAGGWFHALGSFPATNLIRLNSNGTHDPTFKPVTAGLVTSLLARPDGKLLAVAEFIRAGTTSLIAQLTSTGEVDPSFTAPPFLKPRRMALQNDGKLLASSPESGLIRLLTDGSLDPSFQPLPTDVEAITPTPDGHIYIAGNFTSVRGVRRARVARLQNDGSLDLSFIPQLPPIITDTAFGALDSVSLRPDGRVLVAGWNYTARLNSDGSLDPTLKIYGPDYWRLTPLPLSDGRILVFGNANYIEPSGTYSFLAQTNATLSKIIVQNPQISVNESEQANLALRRIGDTSGSLSSASFVQAPAGADSADTDLRVLSSVSFAPLQETGALTIDALGDALIESDETFRVQILKSPDLSIPSEPAFITILDRNGRPGSFTYLDGPPPRQTSSQIAVAADGSVLLAGSGYDPITILRPDGSITNVELPQPFAVWQSVVIAAHSNVFYLAGNLISDPANPDLKLGAIYRILSDGRIDPTFRTVPFRMSPRTIAVESDGKIVVGGSWIYPSQETLMRFNPVGTRLASWSFAYQIEQIAALSDGNILYNPGGYVGIYNLNGGGQTNYNSIAGDKLTAITVDTDSFYVTGNFTNVYQMNQSYPRTGIARAFTNGEIDLNFAPQIFPPNVYTATVDDQHRILITGEFQTINGIACPYVARLFKDGSLDRSFEPGGGPNASSGGATSIRSIAGIPGGGAYAFVQDFTPLYRLARLAPDLPFSLSLVFNKDNAAQVALNTVPGQAYKIESSSNLHDWSPALETNAVGHQVWLPAPNAPVFLRALRTGP